MFNRTDINKLRSFDDVKKLNCFDFEWLCKFVLESKGYDSVQVTKRRADKGIDLVAYKKKVKHYVQCKHQEAGYHGVQPIEPIRALGGCMLRDKVQKGVFMSILAYDKTAYDEADKMGIWLVGVAELDRYLQGLNAEYRPIKYTGAAWN